MKFIKLVFVILFTTGFCTYSHAQDIELIKGDATVIAGQTEVLVTFVYDNMKVGEFTEDLYIKQKRSEYRKPADADKFIAKWKADFKNSHQPKFIEQFNMYIKKLKMSAVTDDTTKYMMIVHTNLIDPGYNNKGMYRETLVNLSVDIVESASPDNVLATIIAEKVAGVGNTTAEAKDQQARITNAYGSCGMRIAKLLVKLCK
ncbi:MAG TPA: hypothetical protein PLB59_03910 [Bacteroidales bacterium]|nr:hypothetical protein [Bacteroidales bacterium]HPI30676.1 hypothetical protein [Bacteroidales bacterium]HQN15578.1 hypothetical protein [Bacteroidales bacterium]HQP15091.1 hypothetical protein [Bacteroidales bacterium]